MAIKKPKIKLTKDEKSLLKILSKLILEFEEYKNLSNIPTAKAVLNDEEADKLYKLLNKYIESRKLYELDYFVSNIFKTNSKIQKDLKKHYTHKLKDYSGNAIVMSFRFNEFKERLGHTSSDYNGPPITPMPQEYFLEMEKLLFNSIDMNPRLQEILLQTVSKQGFKIDKIKSRKIRKKISIRETLKDFSTQVKKQFIDKENLVSAAIIISNSSVIFSTRDWSVAGTLSVLSGETAKIFIKT